MRVIYVDIDETICNRESSVDFGVTHDYTKAHPIVCLLYTSDAADE